MEYLTISQAAKELGVVRKTLWRWDREGILKPEMRIGSQGHRRYSRRQIEEFKKKSRERTRD